MTVHNLPYYCIRKFWSFGIGGKRNFGENYGENSIIRCLTRILYISNSRVCWTFASHIFLRSPKKGVLQRYILRALHNVYNIFNCTLYTAQNTVKQWNILFTAFADRACSSQRTNMKKASTTRRFCTDKTYKCSFSKENVPFLNTKQNGKFVLSVKIILFRRRGILDYVPTPMCTWIFS